MSWWDEKDKYLWQAMGKKDLDFSDELTDKQWADFVEGYADVFAERASELAYKLWLDWLNTLKRQHHTGEWQKKRRTNE